MEREPAVALSYSPGGHPGLRDVVAARYGVRPSASSAQRLAAGVRVPGGAAVRRSGGHPRVRRGADLRPRFLILQRFGADRRRAAGQRRHRRRRARGGAAGARSGVPLHHPELPEPGGVTLSRERAAPGRARRGARLPPRRGRPVRPAALRGRGAADALRARRRRARDDLSSFTKTVAPGSASARRRARRRCRARRQAAETPTSRPACLAGRARRVLRGRQFEPGVERATAALEERRDALVESVDRFLGRARGVVPEGGYFLWLDLPGVDRRARRARAEAGVPFVKGSDFFADGGGRRAAARLLGGAAGGSTRASSGSAPSISRSKSTEPEPCRSTTSFVATATGRRAWSSATRVLPASGRAAGAALPLDRLLRQPRAGERDHRHRSGRALRAPQRREPRRAHRPQLPVGAAVRRRGAAGASTSSSAGTSAAAACGPALDGDRHGLIDNWLRHVQDVAQSTPDLLARRRGRPAPTCSAGSTSSSRSRTSAARRSSRRRGIAAARSRPRRGLRPGRRRAARPRRLDRGAGRDRRRREHGRALAAGWSSP